MYTDPDGRDDEVNWLKEIEECFNSIKVGLRWEASLSLPPFGSVGVNANLASVEYEDGENKYTQGLGASASLGTDDVTVASFSVDYKREGKYSEGFNSPLDLMGYDFELETDLDLNSSAELTLPIPCISISFNLTEMSDLFTKASNAVGEKLDKAISSGTSKLKKLWDSKFNNSKRN